MQALLQGTDVPWSGYPYPGDTKLRAPSTVPDTYPHPLPKLCWSPGAQARAAPGARMAHCHPHWSHVPAVRARPQWEGQQSSCLRSARHHPCRPLSGSRCCRHLHVQRLAQGGPPHPHQTPPRRRPPAGVGCSVEVTDMVLWHIVVCRHHAFLMVRLAWALSSPQLRHVRRLHQASACHVSVHDAPPCTRQRTSLAGPQACHCPHSHRRHRHHQSLLQSSRAARPCPAHGHASKVWDRCR